MCKLIRKIPDYRGEVFHIAKLSELSIDNIKEVYGSKCYPGMYKAWHYHTRQTQNYVVIQGMIRLAVSKNSWTPGSNFDIDFDTHYIGDSNYQRITIQPGYINGYTAVGNTAAIVINVTNLEHDPNEMLRYDLNEFNYDWFKNF